MVVKSDLEFSSTSRLACLCVSPWLENPNRLVSLWDMFRLEAEKLVEVGRSIQYFMDGPKIFEQDQNGYLYHDQYMQLVDMLRGYIGYAEIFSLSVTGRLARKNLD